MNQYDYFWRVMIKYFRTLFLLGLTISVSAFGSVYFTENKGQLRSADPKEASSILFYTTGDNQRFFVRKNSVTKLIYLTSPPNSDGWVIHKEEIRVGDSQSALRVTGIRELRHVSHFYLPQKPEGILNVKSFSQLLFSDAIGKPLFLLSIDQDGNPELTSISSDNRISALIPDVFALPPWSTYLGGTDADETWGVDYDSNNDVVICGQTQSLNFPITPNNQQDTLNGFYDTFVSKFDNSGNLLWSTYLGSSLYDFAGKIAAGSDNTVYLLGYTSGIDFPVSVGCYQNANAGSYDAFITKFTPAGLLIWSTYFGGNGGDLGTALTILPNQDIVIGGSVTGTTFPTSVGAFQSSNNGGMDCFISRFDSACSLIWSTFYGGTGSEDVHSLASDSSGNVLVTGGSFSTDFPISLGCFQNFNAGVKDVFILKFNAAGNRLFATYYGGTAFEDAADVNSDGQNNIYVSGTTASLDFPVSVGCYQNANAGVEDLFILKMDGNGNQIWSTYYGGTGSETNFGMDSPGSGKFFLSGATTSTDFPIIGPGPYMTNQGAADATVVKFNQQGQPVWSTYYGGTLQDFSHAVSVNPLMNVAFTGLTSSSDYPVSFNAYQGNNNGNDDAFVTVLDGTFDITTSSGEQQLVTDDMVIFPNPLVEGELSILSDAGIIEVVIHDPSGRVILYYAPLQNTFISPLKLFLRGVPVGIYSLVIRSTQGTKHKKLIIH